MRIHTDTLTSTDLWRALPDGCHLEEVTRGSRKRDHAFELTIYAEHGVDAHGIKRRYARNTGQWGGAGDYDRAATYIEWGDWMVALFKIDPDAIVGQYDGRRDFVAQTTRMAEHRQAFEHAPEHAARWARELELEEVAAAV